MNPDPPNQQRITGRNHRYTHRALRRLYMVRMPNDGSHRTLSLTSNLQISHPTDEASHVIWCCFPLRLIMTSFWYLGCHLPLLLCVVLALSLAFFSPLILSFTWVSVRISDFFFLPSMTCFRAGPASMTCLRMWPDFLQGHSPGQSRCASYLTDRCTRWTTASLFRACSGREQIASWSSSSDDSLADACNNSPLISYR